MLMNNQFSGRIENPQVIEQLIADKNSNKLFVFGANWCPDCRILAGLIQSAQLLKSIRENFNFLLIDVKNYEVNMNTLKQLDSGANTGIPRVFVFNSSGKLVNKHENDLFRTIRTMHENALVDYLMSFKRP